MVTKFKTHIFVTQVNAAIGYDYKFDPKLWPSVLYLVITTCLTLASLAKNWKETIMLNKSESYTTIIGMYDTIENSVLLNDNSPSE